MGPAKRRRTDFVRRPVKKRVVNPENIESAIVTAAATMGLGDVTTLQTRLGGGEDGQVQGMAPLRTTKKYYRNNWEMLQNRPELFAPVEETIARILGPGVCVVDGRGTIMQPEGEFAKLFNDMILPCLARSIRWLVCYAYVVWADTRDESGKRILFVPDPDQVQVLLGYNKRTGVPETVTKWVSEDIDAAASKLHFYSDSVLGITKGYQASPVDAASSVVDSVISVRIAFHRILERISAAPIGVEDHQKPIGAAPAPHLAELQPAAIEHFLDEDQLLERDIAARERLNAIINDANDNAEAALQEEPELLPPEARMARAMAAPVENSFVPIPPGMRAASIQPPPYFSDFNATDERLIRQVARLMGMQAETAPVSNKNKEGTLGGTAAPEAFTDKQKAWQKAVAELGTQMIEELYPDRKYRVILMSQVYPDRDLCQQLVTQGSMSEETFRSLHPNPIEEEEGPKKKK